MIYIDKNKKRIYPERIIVHDGVEYPGNILHFPKAVKALGIKSINEPAPPDDFSDATYMVSTSDYDPYVVYTRRSKDSVDVAQQSLKNQIARQYLNDTGWYVERFVETGKPIPEEISRKRQEARDAVMHLPGQIL